MLNLYKFYWDCGRMGDLEGLFIATQEQIDSIMGKDIYFGEVLGKHSEIYGTIDAGDITKIDFGNDAVLKLKDVFGKTTLSGYNPLDYVEEDD